MIYDVQNRYPNDAFNNTINEIDSSPNVIQSRMPARHRLKLVKHRPIEIIPLK